MGSSVCFVYGPGPIMDAAEAALTELGEGPEVRRAQRPRPRGPARGPWCAARTIPASWVGSSGWGSSVCFVFGPGPIMDAAEAALTELGVPLDDVHGDRFEWA